MYALQRTPSFGGYPTTTHGPLLGAKYPLNRGSTPKKSGALRLQNGASGVPNIVRNDSCSYNAKMPFLALGPPFGPVLGPLLEGVGILYKRTMKWVPLDYRGLLTQRCS